jgi:hypothetical protein
LGGFRLLWPSQQVAAAFSKNVDVWRNTLVGLVSESATLCNARDSLLGPLVSGGLKLETPERFVGAEQK